MRRLVGTSDYLNIDMYERDGKSKKRVNSAELKPCEFIIQVNLDELKTFYKALNMEFPDYY